MRIEQQLKSVEDDTRKDLEKQLSQIEIELITKDNDAYRRQNATYTYD